MNQAKTEASRSAACIKREVKERGSCLAALPSASAFKTLRALVADDYGVRLVAKLEGGEQLWRVFGERSSSDDSIELARAGGAA